MSTALKRPRAARTPRKSATDWPADVQTFAARHGIVTGLRTALRLIREEFGTDFQIRQEVYANPENPDVEQWIVIRIMMPIGYPLGLTHYDAYVDRWVDGASPTTSGLIRLSLEYG